MQAPHLVSLTVAAAPRSWRAAGFAVDETGVARVGSTALHLAGTSAGEGIVAWALDGVVTAAGEPIDGLPCVEAPEFSPVSPAHPNGARGLDHVVVVTPALSRTLAALADAGLDLRRTRDVPERGIRQAFYRLGDVVLEVVGPPEGKGDGPAAFWGLVVVVEDPGALPDGVAEPPHDAVQEGRRIATAKDRAKLGTHVAFMSP